MENRDAWAKGPGGIGRGAGSSFLWSPLICTKETLFRLLNPEKCLIEEDVEFILSMFRFRDSFIKKFAPSREDLKSSLYLLSDSWELSASLSNTPLQDYYRLYIVVRLVNAFALIILNPSTKTFRIIFAVESGMSAANRDMFQNFVNMMFASNIKDSGVLGPEWKEGCISNPNMNWLSNLDCSVPNEKAQVIFIVYVIYYLTVEAPVFFLLTGDNGKTLRENLAFYCLKGNLPY